MFIITTFRLNPKILDILERKGDIYLIAEIKSIIESSGTTKVFLLNCQIAGTSYIEDIKYLEDDIYEQDELLLERESKNEFDKMAVVVKDKNKNKLGYIPKSKNEVVARVIDAGLKIYGVLKYKEWQDQCLILAMGIYVEI